MTVEQKAIHRHCLAKLPMGDGNWIQGMIDGPVYDMRSDLWIYDDHIHNVDEVLIETVTSSANTEPIN